MLKNPPMDNSQVVLVTAQLFDRRSSPDNLEIVEMPLRVYSFCAREWVVKAEDLISNMQSGPSRIEVPAKVYFVQGSHRQCIMQLDTDRKCLTITGTLPVTSDWAVRLDIEDLHPSPLDSGVSDDTSSSFNDDVFMETAYHKAVTVLKDMPNDCLPGVPRWTPQELAEHDYQLSRLSAEELVQLEALRFHETRKHQWTEPPLNFEMEYGTGNSLPYRVPRPWEYQTTDVRTPEWLQHRQLRKNTSASHWDPRVKPIYPTFVFNPDQWVIPDNSKYSKKEKNEAAVKYLKTLLVEKPGYMEFTESKGRTLPLLDLLRQYFFAKSMLNELTKVRCPSILPVCGGCIITKENVLAALGRKPSWGSDCLETLELVEQYGPFGQYETPAVTDVIYAPLDDQCGSVNFLKFLRSIDREWHENNRELIVEQPARGSESVDVTSRVA